MSDGIKPISYFPQIKQVNPKGRNSNRKDGKKGEQEFPKLIQVSDGDEKGNMHNKGDTDQKNADEGADEKKDLPKTSDVDEGCGTIIDIEA